MIKLTLDTSCYDKKSEMILNELAKFQKEGLIDIWHEVYSESETDNWISPDKEKIMGLFHNFSKSKNDAYSIPKNVIENQDKHKVYMEKQRGYTSRELHLIHTKIDRLIYPEGFEGKKNLNKYVDNKILALHIVRGRNIFLTKDKVLFKRGEKYKLIEKEFPEIKVRLLNQDFIGELRRLINNNQG